jgi:hypothetical protein
MESIMPNPTPSVLQMLGYMGGLFSTIYVLLAFSLTAWFVVLILRVCSLSNHCAYIGATLIPLLFGFMGALSGALHLTTLVGVYGIAQGIDTDVAVTFRIREILIWLYCGSLLTCIFFPLGIMALLIRRPK